MFMALNKKNEYVSAEPHAITNAPVIVARFVNESSFKAYMHDNHPTVTGSMKLVDMETGKAIEVTL